VPHVVIQGSVDLAAYAKGFQPIVVRRHRDVLRADKLYREEPGRALLIEALAVEAGRKLGFYIKVTDYDGERVTVRIDPLTHPDRSEGVKLLIAHVARDILSRNPGARVEKTNLVLPSASASECPDSALPDRSNAGDEP